MKKNNLIMLVVAMAIVAVVAFKFTNAESSQTDADNNPNNSMKRWVNNIEKTKTDVGNKEDQSVAWYVANAKEARDQNKECHDNPSIQSTPNCVNSLHALQISFAGGSGRR